MLAAEPVAYVEDTLVELLGAAAMNNDKECITQLPPLLEHVEAVYLNGEYEPPPPKAHTASTKQCCEMG